MAVNGYPTPPRLPEGPVAVTFLGESTFPIQHKTTIDISILTMARGYDFLPPLL
jgi:hypothetical protein